MWNQIDDLRLGDAAQPDGERCYECESVHDASFLASLAVGEAEEGAAGDALRKSIAKR